MSAICAAFQLGYAASCRTYIYGYYLAAATTSLPFITPFLSPLWFLLFLLPSLAYVISATFPIIFTLLLSMPFTLFLSSHPFNVFLNLFQYYFFLCLIPSLSSLLSSFSISHLPPLLPFLNSDFHPAATTLLCNFNHQRSLWICQFKPICPMSCHILV